MSTSGKSGGAQISIPAGARKTVQSLKEIVNCPELEIYAMLKDCNMDPNEAVNRLLTQDPFREVKSKRDKKKEHKDHTDSRSRGGNKSSNRGTRSTDHYERVVLSQFSSYDSGALHGKPAYKKENGTNLYVSSSSASGVAPDNSYQPPTTPSVSVANENKASIVSASDDNLSVLQPSSGYQPVWAGVPGKKSMADIVKMGRPQTKAPTVSQSSHNTVNHQVTYELTSSEVYPDLPSSKDRVSRVSDLHTEPGVIPEWPVIEPPQASIMSSVLESHSDSQLHPDQSNSAYDNLDQHTYTDTNEVEAEEDSSVEDLTANRVSSVTVSSRNIQEDTSGDASLFDGDMYTNMGSYKPHHTFENEEEDVGASVSSQAANLQQLSIQEDDHEASYQQDGPSVVFPSHLQVGTADCSHLSFGSFGTGAGTGFSGPFATISSKSNMEETSPEADVAVTIHSNTRNPEYYEDESVRTAVDGNLVHRPTAGGGSFDSSSASHSEVLKQENQDVSHINQYAFPSSSPGYAFDSSQQLNAAFNYSQTSSQMQNLTPFSTAAAYTNALPSALLAANIHPGRESELPYSPFPLTQSMPTKYGNGASSISGSAISVTEALKTGFQSVQPTPQNLSAASIATGPALPQHLAMHTYSQPTLPLGPFTNMIGYPFLPQSYTYMPSGFQQAFAGNSTYHQSLAAVLPQYKNSISGSNLPQSAAVPSGYAAFGSSSTIPGNYTMNQPTASPAGSTIGYDDVLSSQYKDNNHLISLQQNDNSGMWLHGGSRTMSAVPGSTYYSFHGQNQQQPSGFRQGQQPSQNYGALGYPNFYHSQPGMSLEHQPQSVRDGSLGGSQGQPKQSQQIWQNSY